MQTLKQALAQHAADDAAFEARWSARSKKPTLEEVTRQAASMGPAYGVLCRNGVYTIYRN